MELFLRIASRMRPSQRWGAFALLVASFHPFAIPAYAANVCRLKALELPVTMIGTRPVVHAKINGADAAFVADSGAFYSSLTTAAAQQFKLRLDPSRLKVMGVGGMSETWITRVQTFTLGPIDIPRVEFLVLPNDPGGETIGLLGQNVFQFGDVEYDLANGVIRLIRAQDCKSADLAYWAAAEKKNVSEMPIEPPNPANPHTMGEAYINGTRIRVVFDTGASTSALTLSAAKRAGILPDSPGVTPGGYMHGVGNHVYQSYIATFDSFKIGDNEEIKHARLRFNEMQLAADMLVGVDFFLSHRIYVAASQHKIYFTYNGGPVFDLRSRDATLDSSAGSPAAATSEPTDGAAATPGSTATGAGTADQTADAAALARHGMAAGARHEYEQAIADLTRAIQIAPTESSYFRERGLAYWSARQGELALHDFDQALSLQPADARARILRAQLRLQRHAPPADVASDLEAADRALPKQDEARQELATIFLAIADPHAAVLQYSMWIDSHDGSDIEMGRALNGRCWARALWNQELEQALSDCNHALQHAPHAAAYFDSRGLVHLRLGNYDKAIADYDASIAVQPRNAWALYGRGLARARKGQTDQSDSDIAAAKAIWPHIGEEAAKFGIQP